MLPNEDSLVVEYGRVGAGGFQTTTYPLPKYDSLLRSKLKKGYVDRTDLVSDLIVKEKPKAKQYIDIDSKSVAEIVDRLQLMARKAISDNYTISSNKVTQAMVDEAQSVLYELTTIDDLELFNKTLINLFSVIPRKMGKVANFLANSLDDRGKIILAEQDLLDVMRGQVVQHATIDESDEPEAEYQMTILEALGLRFAEVDESDVTRIKKQLGSCANQYRCAWNVENIKTNENYIALLSREEISVTKLLWHGSRNENWWSIINSGLVLKPTNAVITGKMFGYGTYFATKARKSVGYTSLSGSYWAKGKSTSAFMGLYDVAYGKPFDVHSFDSRYNRLNYDELQKFMPGANCLHAHEGQMLRNDEIIVYKEDQTTIKYLVEISD